MVIFNITTSLSLSLFQRICDFTDIRSKLLPSRWLPCRFAAALLLEFPSTKLLRRTGKNSKEKINMFNMEWGVFEPMLNDVILQKEKKKR